MRVGRRPAGASPAAPLAERRRATHIVAVPRARCRGQGESTIVTGAPRSSNNSSSAAARADAPVAGTSQPRSSRLFAAIDSVITRVLAYYLVLFVVAYAVWQALPAGVRSTALLTFAPLLVPSGVFGGGGGGGGFDALGRGEFARAAAAGAAGGQEPIAIVATVAAIGAFLLALPVAWVYMFTHHKKGYRQSSVHTLVLLPVVVAGITVLVKNSLALAFALAGIVAAVRFRTTLEDSKDAVYLFLATGLGLAAGVELDIAVSLSVTFNAIVLVLWYTDFARTPPRLEGVRAQRQLERALAIANRTSQFVARVDQEILQGMAPEQLDALAARVLRRRAEGDPTLPNAAAQRFDARLSIVTTDVDALRDCIEPALEGTVKRWRFVGARSPSEAGAEEAVVEYEVRWRRDAAPGVVLDAVRESGAPYVVRVSVLRDEPEADAAVGAATTTPPDGSTP